MHTPQALSRRARLGLWAALGLGCGGEGPAPKATAPAEDSASSAALDTQAPDRAGVEAQPLPACDPRERAALGPFAAPFEPSPHRRPTFITATRSRSTTTTATATSTCCCPT